jgi:hypothetical protein
MGLLTLLRCDILEREFRQLMRMPWIDPGVEPIPAQSIQHWTEGGSNTIIVEMPETRLFFDDQ